MTRVTNEELDEIADSLAPFPRSLLLTGAGFSKPWGGFLTSEFWSLIVSHPEIPPRIELNRILHDDLNFEIVLARIENTERADFSDADRVAMRNAVTQAFKVQDDRIALGDHGHKRLGFLDRVVRSFSDETATTCLFTLNQDLLMERFFMSRPELGIQIPGVRRQDPFDGDVLPFDANAFRAAKEQRSYIKLHGSMNWREAGDDVHVLGGAKAEAIGRFDILRMNNAIFRRAVREPGARLMVIGYGFGDPHINETIAVGARAGLRIWIVDPKDPLSIRQQLRDVNASGLIWQAVVGHSAGPVDDLFEPGDEFALVHRRFLDT